MRAEIERRIRAVYPTERLDETSVEQYFGRDYDDRLWNTLGEVAARAAIELDSNWAWEKDQENRYGLSTMPTPASLNGFIHRDRKSSA